MRDNNDAKPVKSVLDVAAYRKKFRRDNYSRIVFGLFDGQASCSSNAIKKIHPPPPLLNAPLVHLNSTVTGYTGTTIQFVRCRYHNKK